MTPLDLHLKGRAVRGSPTTTITYVAELPEQPKIGKSQRTLYIVVYGAIGTNSSATPRRMQYLFYGVANKFDAVAQLTFSVRYGESGGCRKGTQASLFESRTCG
ncbi:MAG: hypothetical protein ACREX0_19010, partial [Noviherbaspirillum sp.]